MQGKINYQKISEYLKSNYFSRSWRISKLEKPVPSFSKTLYLNITILYKPAAYIWKYFKILQVKNQATAKIQPQQLILIHIRSWYLFHFWTNFHLVTVNTVQSSKINRQPSKLEKLYCQQSNLPPHIDTLQLHVRFSHWNLKNNLSAWLVKVKPTALCQTNMSPKHYSMSN